MSETSTSTGMPREIHVAPRRRAATRRPTPVDLAALARDVARAGAARLGLRTALELEIDDDLPEVFAHKPTLHELVTRLFASAAQAIDSDWGTVTLGTGLLGIGRPPLFAGDPGPHVGAGSFAWLEVHSTGPVVGPLSSPYPRAPLCARGFSPLGVDDARKWLEDFHGDVRVDAPDTGGASVMLLLPVALFDVTERVEPRGR